MPDENKNEEKKKDGNKDGGFLKNMGMLSSMGISMVLSTFIGLVAGIYLDKYFDTKPWLTILFLLFGIAAGFKNIYIIAKKYSSEM